MTNDFNKAQLEKWITKFRKQPDLAGWFIDLIQIGHDIDTRHMQYQAISVLIDKPWDEIDFHAIDPHEVIEAIIKKRRNKEFDWSDFEKHRNDDPRIKFPNRYDLE